MGRVATLVGSRALLDSDEEKVVRVCDLLNELEFIGRSGGALGMDTLWEENMEYTQVILPHVGFNGRSITKGSLKIVAYKEQAPGSIKHLCEELVKDIHLYPDTLRGFSLNAHCRNMLQVLGLDLQDPSEMTIYAAPENLMGVVKGGTRTAVVLSRERGIPTFNIRKDAEYSALITLLESMLEE